MIDISHKEISLRIASASGKIKLKKETIELIRKNQIKKEM
jgi:Molybdenum cofactor biosynthesis enzyme